MKSLIMKEAWAIAKRAVKFKGGKAKEWLAWALVRAWEKAKNGELTQNVENTSKPILKGSMTDKQEGFISSLLFKKVGKYETSTLIQAFRSGVRENISKSQASQLIEYLISC